MTYLMTSMSERLSPRGKAVFQTKKNTLFSLLSDRISPPLVSLSIKRPSVGCKFAGFSGKTCAAGAKALILQM